MRNLLALVGLVVVAFGGLGWYFQWYTFARKTGLDGKTQLTLDVDTRKIAEDAKAAGDRIGNAVPAPPVPPVTPVTTPDPAPNTLVGPPTPPWYPTNPPRPPVGPPTPPWYPLPPTPIPSRGPNR